MKIDTSLPNKFNMVLRAVLIFALVGCGSITHNRKGFTLLDNSPLPLIPNDTMSQQRRDTIKKLLVVHDNDNFTKKAINLTTVAPKQPSIDSTVLLNQKLQTALLRSLDRNYPLRQKNDSLQDKILRNTDEIIAAQKTGKTDHTQLAVTYSMFDYIIWVCLIICTLGALKNLYPSFVQVVSWVKRGFKKNYV